MTPGHDAADDRGQRSPARVLHDDGRDRAGERKHRADGKVDVAVGHHECEADGEQRDLGKGEQRRKRVVEAGPEIGPRPRGRTAKARP